MSFVVLQNPHDHPLLLVFRGSSIDRLISHCNKLFPDNTFPLENYNLRTIMQGVMPIHFRQRDSDYFIFCKLNEEQVLVAFNHRFHDVKSIDLLLKLDGSTGYEQRAVTLATVIKRQPDPAEQRAFYPMKMVNMTIGRELMDKLTAKFNISVNECLFWVLCSTINYSSSSPSTEQVMCLHNVRKTIQKHNVPGGDYSCLVTPMSLETRDDKKEWPLMDTLPAIKTYFQGLRENNLNWGENEKSSSMKGVWMYDTWIGSDITNPPLFEGISLDTPAISSMFSVVVDKFALALKWSEEWRLVMYADTIQLPESYTDQLEALVA